MQALDKLDLWLPAQQLLRQCTVRHAIHRPSRHFGFELNFRVAAQHAEDLTSCIDDLRTLHGANVHCGAVIDFFASHNRTFDNVVNVSPVPNLLAVSPDIERILASIGTGDHGYHGVVFHASGAIGGEIAAAS